MRSTLGSSRSAPSPLRTTQQSDLFPRALHAFTLTTHPRRGTRHPVPRHLGSRQTGLKEYASGVRRCLISARLPEKPQDHSRPYGLTAKWNGPSWKATASGTELRNAAQPLRSYLGPESARHRYDRRRALPAPILLITRDCRACVTHMPVYTRLSPMLSATHAPTIH